MKKLMISAVLALISLSAFAQEKKTEAGKAIQTIGHKTAKVAVKGASAITDKTYEDKVGPQGQTVYIDKHSKYYYVNSKGGKVYVSKLKLKDKPKE